MKRQGSFVVVFFLLGIVFALVAYDLATEVYPRSFYAAGEYSGGVDIAADGGALGFCFLAAACFACSTFLAINRQT